MIEDNLVRQGGRPAGALDKYTTIYVIGKGSYAKVILVRNTEDGKLYALKVLNKERVELKRQENHVKTERDILVEMNRSPFLVNFFGSFQTPTKLYFILEYCAGGELFNYLQKCKRFDEKTTKFYASQMVLAIEHLHKKDIVYRDLKPENVLIDGDGYIKISDFGLSRINVKGNDAKSICGTPEYLAPEIIMKIGYGKPVDWWTFGSIVFEMLTGFPPFYTKNRNELFERIKFAPPSYPSYLSPTAKNFLECLLRKDPNKRLGATNGAAEVKAHEWFAGINFDDILNKRVVPQFKPKVDANYGLQNFDKEFTDLNTVSPDVDKNFKRYENFTWEDKLQHSETEKDVNTSAKTETPSSGASSGKMNFDPIREEDPDTRMVEE